MQPSHAVTLKIQQLPHAEGLPLPSYATRHSAGMDLHAAVQHDRVLAPMERAAVPTGLIIAVPAGYEGQIRARSGRALREGLALVNAPGTLDADYRGEVSVLVINLGRENLIIARGERIAQLVIAPIAVATVETVQRWDETDRGTGGFGSTGR